MRIHQLTYALLNDFICHCYGSDMFAYTILAILDTMTHIVQYTIERNTRGQSGNPEWQAQRASRITASTFYNVLHTKNVEYFCRRLHERKLEPSLSTNIWACRIGLESEVPAMRAYAAQFASEVGSYYQPGPCVSKRHPQLAATPDFIVYSDTRAPA